MNLETILQHLKDKHIYPSSFSKNKKGEVTEYEVSASPIVIDDKKKYLEKILKGKGVVVRADRKNQVLVIREKP